ncbi:MAG: tRNA-binding protein [Candidatus Pacebacteria bacterium]|nr:tRNA-binding protein [Candidatus Paceibacterota bacterium]
MEIISWNDFEKVQLLVGTIVAVHDFPEVKKPAYKLDVDLGDLGIKHSSAQITVLYKKEELIGKQVVCVVNFAPKNIGPFVSEVLVTGFYRENGDVVLCVPDKTVGNGAKLG